MTSAKIYYIVRSTHGCSGEYPKLARIGEPYTSKRAAARECERMKRENNDKRVIFWTDFDWR